MITRRRHPATRPAMGLLAGVGLALSLLAPVAGHAALLLANPAPGTGLPQAPAAVVLKFSEPLNLALSRIAVLDDAGGDVGEGATLSVAGDRFAMQRKLGAVAVGRYQVRWSTVSSLDGHSLHGSYGFAVGMTAKPEEVVLESPIDSEGWLGLGGRFAALLGMALWFGFGVLGGTARRIGLTDARLRALALVGPAAAAVGGSLALASTAIVATGSVADIGGVLSSGSGQLCLVGILAALLALIVALLPGDLLARWRRAASVLLASGAVILEAASGHAAATTFIPLAIASFSAHLAAAGLWSFAIVAALMAGRHLPKALAAFTPWAVGAAALTAATGVLNGLLSLDDPGQLLGTSYGITLILKSVAFAAMLALGATHWLIRRRGGSWRAAGADEVRVPARGEAVAALTALLLATLLVGYPNPPRAAEAGEQLGELDPVLSSLEGRDALSVGAASGAFVVGLTILPPRPGPVEVRVQVLGVQPGDGLRDARVELATAGQAAGTATVTFGLAPCGLGCFAGKGNVPRATDWTFGARITSNRGAISASFTLPMPAADGSADLARVRQAMAGLRAVRLHETITGFVGGTPVVSDYEFKAPDAMRLTVGGTTRVVIGADTWSRAGPQATWIRSSSPGASFRWPSAYFDALWGDPVAARIIGSDVVDGSPSTVVGFLRPDIPAWFRVWIGEDGLVRREAMRAEGHIMDHAFTELNGQVQIEPPR